MQDHKFKVCPEKPERAWANLYDIYEEKRNFIMKTLLVMRHAKSSWDYPDLADFDRPLSSIGLDVAPFMGNIMYQNKLQPDLIVCSPAKRARQTAVLIKEVAGSTGHVEYKDRLYEASPNAIMEIVSNVHNAYESVLLIGHNPGIEDFIRILTGNVETMPSGSIAKINFDIGNWSDLQADCGSLEMVLRPKELMKDVKNAQALQNR